MELQSDSQFEEIEVPVIYLRPEERIYWAAQQDELWAWGEIEVKKNCVLLTGDGGYKCDYCKLKFKGIRFDVLKGHLAKCTQKPDPFDEGIYKRILKFRSACDKCRRILDLTGNKKERHLQSCKGFEEKTEEHKQEGINEQIKQFKKANNKLTFTLLACLVEVLTTRLSRIK